MKRIACSKLQKKRNQRGVGLLELMIYISILGILASMAAPKLMSVFSNTKVKTTKISMQNIATSLDLYKVEHGAYPTTAEGLSVLDMTKTPKDAWGNTFEYMSPGYSAPYDLISRGADGKDGGDGNDADITFEGSN